MTIPRAPKYVNITISDSVSFKLLSVSVTPPDINRLAGTNSITSYEVVVPELGYISRLPATERGTLQTGIVVPITANIVSGKLHVKIFSLNNQGTSTPRVQEIQWNF